MATTLSRFTIEPQGEDFLLLIEDDNGATIEMTATLEQLDLLGEAIDELLEKDDASED
jgi:hypothetical protein